MSPEKECSCFYAFNLKRSSSYPNWVLFVKRLSCCCGAAFGIIHVGTPLKGSTSNSGTHIYNKVAQLQIHQTPIPSLIIGCSCFLHARILGNPSYIFKYTPPSFFDNRRGHNDCLLVRLPGHSSGGKPRHCGREPTQHSAPTGFQTFSPKSLFSDNSPNLKG